METRTSRAADVVGEIRDVDGGIAVGTSAVCESGAVGAERDASSLEAVTDAAGRKVALGDCRTRCPVVDLRVPERGPVRLAQIAFAQVVIFDVGKGASPARIAGVFAATLLSFLSCRTGRGRRDRSLGSTSCELVRVSIAGVVLAAGARPRGRRARHATRSPTIAWRTVILELHSAWRRLPGCVNENRRWPVKPALGGPLDTEGGRAGSWRVRGGA